MESETSMREIKASKIKYLKERLARSLQVDKNIVILPADKGDTTGYKVEYSNELADLIDNSGSCEVKKDSTLKIEKKLSQIFSKNKDLIP